MGCDACKGKGNCCSVEAESFKILLMGNPNVGKSVIFSKYTSLNVLASNYAGTTVSFTKGEFKYRGSSGMIIDVPGIYSLKSESPAEDVAVKMLDQENADVIFCVLDATNLERNLFLALQLKQKGIPIVFALNFVDVAKKRGISIDRLKLQEELNAPVVETVAIQGVGLKELLEKALAQKDKGKRPESVIKYQATEKLWKESEAIASKVISKQAYKETFLEKLGNLTVKPLPGLPIAVLVLAVLVGFVVGGGITLRQQILLPVINGYVIPFVVSLVAMFVNEGTVLFNVLVGDYGAIVKMIEWPLALILPYVFLFYVALSFLEDSGYLPRLGVLVDGIFQKIGMQGGNVVPFIMGYGCAVPAILGAKAATSQKERITIAALVSLAVPCVAQTGAFISLLGEQSIFALVVVYLISFLGIIIAGVVLKKLVPGKVDLIILEIPNMLWPDMKALFKKIYIRVKHFIIEAQVPMFIAIVFAALLAETGVLDRAGEVLEPLVSGWLGLPKDATLSLILGVIRRELAVLPLLELDLTTLQLIVGAVVALFYLPCLSVLAVLIKEFSLKIALSITAMTVIVAILAGGIVNIVGGVILSIV